MPSERKLAPSRALAAKLIHAALSILRDNGKEMQMRDLMAKVEKTVKLDDWARERYEKSGYVRWESILHFFRIDCVKAGYLIKKKGVWYLTPEGEGALKLGPEKLLEQAGAAYNKWRVENPKIREEEVEEETPLRWCPTTTWSKGPSKDCNSTSIQRIPTSSKILSPRCCAVWDTTPHS